MSLDDRLRNELRSVAPRPLDEDDARGASGRPIAGGRCAPTAAGLDRARGRDCRGRGVTLPRNGSTKPSATAPSSALRLAARRDIGSPPMYRERDRRERRSAAAGDNAFGFDLYNQISSGTGNIVFSPQSLATRLAMTVLGAHGATQAQMLRVLHATDATQLSQEINALDQQLLAPRHASTRCRATTWVHPRADHHRRLDVGADRLLALQDVPRRDRSEYYGAGVNLVNFATNPDAARLAINRYVSAKTHGMTPTCCRPAWSTSPPCSR